MDKNELLKYLICEIDLVMHDKDYRFENEDGTWYSRESCKNLTNEEVFEELKSELRQLAKIEDDFADLEAKLAESEKLNKRLQQVIDKLRDKEFAGETLVNAVNAVYEPLYQNKYDEAEQLKQQLTETDKLMQEYLSKCLNLEQQLAEKEKEVAQKVIKRVEELSVFDFEAYEEMDFRRYIISQMALDNILKEYGVDNDYRRRQR